MTTRFLLMPALLTIILDRCCKSGYSRQWANLEMEKIIRTQILEEN